MSKLFPLGVTLIAIGIILGIGGWYRAKLRPVTPARSGQAYIEIKPGMSSAQIAELLEMKELIRDDVAFRLHLRVRGLSARLQAGFYAIGHNLSAPEVAAILTEGKTATNVIQIPSGKTLAEIKSIMLKSDFKKDDINRALSANYDFSVLKDKPANASLEGYLYPDTYHLGVNATVQDLVTMVLANTEVKITPEIRQAWSKRGLNIHEGITLASIVQKEMPTPEEQQKAAQVFLKRLKASIKLKADPTYIYAARELGVTPSPGIDSPYNTYKVVGLPPGPIGNTEISALLAVANPASTDYLYFVTGKDGVTRFSKSETQHLNLIDKYGVSGD